MPRLVRCVNCGEIIEGDHIIEARTITGTTCKTCGHTPTREENRYFCSKKCFNEATQKSSDGNS